jgi:NodT family efflux transporter outer membrane factor (OMF) lipoprotein
MTAQRAFAAGFVALLLLTGCTTVGPDFEEPDALWLSQWQSDLYGQVSTAAGQTSADLEFWWYLFDDPVLNDLIGKAKAENLDLRIAALRILESRAVLGIAGSAALPQLQQLGGALSYVNSERHGGASSNGDDSLVAYSADFAFGWELDFWGRFRRGLESADAAFFASMSRYQDAQVLLAAQMADFYYSYLTTLKRIEIANGNADIQARSLDITNKLYASGQESELDLQQASTQYYATLSTIPELEILATRLRNAICVLLARAPGDLGELVDVPDSLPSLDPLLITAIPAELVMRRPDVRAAAWQVAAQSAQIGIARADYFPSISLAGTVGWSGDDMSATPDVSTLAAGPLVSWNIFNYGRVDNNVRIQDSRLEQATASFQAQLQNAAHELDNAAISVVKTRERQTSLRSGVAAATRALDIANIRYREGYSDFNRVLDAQRALFSATERDLVNQGNHLAAVIEFYKALGGGWLATPVDRMLPMAVRERMQTRSNWGDLLTQPLPSNDVGPQTIGAHK